MSAGRENHRVGQIDRSLPGLQVECQGAEAHTVADQQPRDVSIFVNLNSQCAHLIGERKQHRPSREVARITRPAVPVRAEEALVQSTVGQTCEGATPFAKLEDRCWCFSGQNLDSARIGQIVTLDDRVGKMVLPAICRVDRPERGVDAARRQDGVGVLALALADDHDFSAGGVDSDGGAQSRGTGSDDQYVRDPSSRCFAAHE